MTRLLTAAVVLSCLTLFTTNSALADDLGEAVALAREGKRLLEEERHGEALVQFERSLFLNPHPKVRFFKATCLYHLDERLGEAAAILHAIGGDPRLGDYAAEVPVLATRVAEKMAVPLVVAVKGGGDATVWVDGTDQGPAPLRARFLSGAHGVEVKGVGCLDGPRDVWLLPGKRLELTFRCVPADELAAFDLRSSEPGLVASVDGAPPASGDTTWAWVTLGSGVALMGTGVGFLARYGMDLAGVRKESDTYRGDRVGTTNVTVGSVTLGVGVGLVVTSFFLWPDDDEVQTAVGGLRIDPTPGGAQLGYGFSF